MEMLSLDGATVLYNRNHFSDEGSERFADIMFTTGDRRRDPTSRIALWADCERSTYRIVMSERYVGSRVLRERSPASETIEVGTRPSETKWFEAVCELPDLPYARPSPRPGI